MRILILFSVFTFISTSINSQSNWKYQTRTDPMTDQVFEFVYTIGSGYELGCSDPILSVSKSGKQDVIQFSDCNGLIFKITSLYLRVDKGEVADFGLSNNDVTIKQNEIVTIAPFRINDSRVGEYNRQLIARIIEEMKAGSVLKIRAEMDGRVYGMTFSLTGFTKAYNKL